MNRIEESKLISFIYVKHDHRVIASTSFSFGVN